MKQPLTEGPLGFPMSDRAAHQVEQIIKALPKGKETEYRRRAIAPATAEVVEGERADVSWITTESPDRYGEVVIAKGMIETQFAANPVVTLGHNYRMPAVGRSLWRKRMKAQGDAPAGVKAKTLYPARPPEWGAEQGAWPSDGVWALVKAGLLNGKSVGFLPTKFHLAEGKEAAARGWEKGTLVFDEWLLLEYCVCMMPVNQDALVEVVARGMAIAPEITRELLGDAPPPPPAPAPTPEPAGSPVGFATLQQITQDFFKRLAGIDWKGMAESTTEAVIQKARGRV